MPLVLHTSLLNGYRAFLAKLSPKTYLDDAYQCRSSKLLRRLRAKARRTRVAIDPFRAFRRLKSAMTLNLLKQTTTTHRSISRVFRRSSMKSIPHNSSPELLELFGQEGWIRTGIILALVGASQIFMRFASRTEISGEHYLQQAMKRDTGQALITVSNHVGSIDDPLVVAALVPAFNVFHPENVRWTMCATDRCFSNPWLTSFFRSVKVLPVERGAGLHQLGMRAAEYRLNQGDWVHIFPEGTRSRKEELLPPRLGIGKLVANCDRLPIVVPFIHSGMSKVIPPGSKLPRIGNKIRISVGEPIVFDDVTRLAEENGWTDKELYMAITHKIGRRMAELWSQLESKPVPNWAATHFSLSSAKISHHTASPLVSPFVSAQIFQKNITNRLRQSYEHISLYLSYCRLRRQSMMNQLFPCM